MVKSAATRRAVHASIGLRGAGPSLKVSGLERCITVGDTPKIAGFRTPIRNSSRFLIVELFIGFLIFGLPGLAASALGVFGTAIL